MCLLDQVAVSFDKLVPTEVILPHVKLLDSSSRHSPAFNDPKYLPFYYRLGCISAAKRVIQIGSKQGLVGAAFLRGCRTVEEWTVIDETRTCPSIIESNLKLNGTIGVKFRYIDQHPLHEDDGMAGSMDVAFLTEEFEVKKREFHLEYLWSRLKPGGLLVVDYIHDDAASDSFSSFCRVKNRESVSFKTRYGVEIITR